MIHQHHVHQNIRAYRGVPKVDTIVLQQHVMVTIQVSVRVHRMPNESQWKNGIVKRNHYAIGWKIHSHAHNQIQKVKLAIFSLILIILFIFHFICFKWIFFCSLFLAHPKKIEFGWEIKEKKKWLFGYIVSNTVRNNFWWKQRRRRKKGERNKIN